MPADSAFPDPDYPPAVQCRIKNTGLLTLRGQDALKDEEEPPIPVPVLATMVVAAFRTLHEPNGSSVKAARRLLVSEKFIGEHTDLRPAVIYGLKHGIIQRSPQAVQNGVYGIYIASDTRRPRVAKGKKGKAKKPVGGRRRS